MKNRSLRAQRFVPVLSVLSLAVAASVQAQDIQIDPVVVSASRIEQPRSTSAVIVDVISRQQIEQAGTSNIAEFLDTVSGVSLTRLYGQTGVDASLDIGYMGESGAQNVLILIDGQRINALDQSSLRFAQLPMSSIERIEVRKANGGVLYGDRAQGGVINIITRKDTAKEVELSVGSFGTHKLDAYLGLKSESAQGSVSLMSANSDGYRVHSESTQNSVQVKLATIGDWGRLSGFARGFEEKAQMPSYLTQTQFVSNPRAIGAYPATSDRSGRAAGVRYERALDDDAVFSIDLATQSSLEKAYDTIRNMRSTVTPELHKTLGSGTWVFGAELADSSANTNNGKQVNQQSLSLYVQTTQPLSSVSNIELGARTQKVDNNFQVSISDAATSASTRESGLSAALRHQLSQNTVIRAGGLAGFRFANADELYYFRNAYPYTMLEINTQVKPMESQEFFAQLEHSYSMGKVDIHYRNIRTIDEIGYQYSCGAVANYSASCNTNLYDTQRQILSFTGSFKPSNTLTLKAGVDFVDATIENGSNVGNRIPLTPKRVVKLTAEQRIGAYTLMATSRYRSDTVQASDPGAFNPLIPSRNVVDLGMKTSLSKTWSLSTWVRNAFNKSYYDYANYGIYPADGRGLFVNLKASL
jgi:iron complex outermembrane receptor protein